MCAAAVCLPQQFCLATAHFKRAEAFCKASLPSPKHRHPPVHFLFRISAVPVGLPRLTWRPQLQGGRDRRLGAGGVIKWEKARGQGERKVFMRIAGRGGGRFRVLHARTNNAGERSDGSHHPASVLRGRGRGGGGDLKSQQRRPLQQSHTSFMP